jgi:Zn-finger nucleic acid-binding protein
MKCPKCKTIEITKSGRSLAYSCENCGGLWLADSAALAFSDGFDEINDREFAPNNENDDRTGLCPSGHGIMLRARVDLEDPFFLERCTACGGIWFDKGEWQRFAKSRLSHNLNDLWSRSWQRRQLKEKSRETYLEINRKLLGEEVFQAVVRLAERLKDHPEKGRALALLNQEIS